MSHPTPTTTPTTSSSSSSSSSSPSSPSPGAGHPILGWEYGSTNPPVGTLLSTDGKRTPLPVNENHKNTNVKLFHQMKIHDITLKNRIWVSPMCQYTAIDGFFSDWHLVHLGQFAIGGAAVVMTEATAVSPEGRISPNDTGLWKDEHIPQLRRITDFIRSQHSVPAIQLAHAGRKASTFPPFLESGRVAVDEKHGGWPETVVAPSAIEWDKDWIKPKELSKEQIQKLVKDFADATVRAEKAGFDVVEIHGAHGYLIHEFLSPLSNHRTDEYGGSLANRARFVIEVIRAVRAVWPRNKVLGARFSATDWVDGGFNLEEFVQVVGMLIPEGIDFVDVSSGGQHPAQKIPVGPGYQVFAAEAVKRVYGDKIYVGSVGMLTDPQQCEDVLQKGQADFVLLARELLRSPHWALRAAKALGVNIAWSPQYQRAKI